MRPDIAWRSAAFLRQDLQKTPGGHSQQAAEIHAAPQQIPTALLNTQQDQDQLLVSPAGPFQMGTQHGQRTKHGGHNKLLILCSPTANADATTQRFGCHRAASTSIDWQLCCPGAAPGHACHFIGKSSMHKGHASCLPPWCPHYRSQQQKKHAPLFYLCVLCPSVC